MTSETTTNIPRSSALAAMVLWGFAACCYPSLGQIVVETDFDDQTTQGWTGVGVRDPGPAIVSPGASGAPDDFYFEVTDTSSSGNVPGLNILAPEAFLGRYGTIADTCGSLELDIRVFEDQNDALTLRINFATDPDGFLNGEDPELRARFRLEQTIDETSGWQHVVVPLGRRDPAGNLPSNDQGTWEMVQGFPEQWNSLLDNVDVVYIPLEYGTGINEKVGIDNVRLVASECPCPAEPNRLQTAGIQDDFASPNDPARRSFLGSLTPPIGWKSFDDTRINRWVGHTFNGLSRDTVDGELEIRMRPGQSSQSNNDTIHLGLAADGSILYSSPIRALDEANGSWRRGQNGSTLFRIPLTQPVVDKIIADGRLEMAVLDDTTVDYATLRIRLCPPPRGTGGVDCVYGDLTEVTPNLEGGWTAQPFTDTIEFTVETGDSQGNCIATDDLCPGLGDALTIAAMGRSDELTDQDELIGTLEFGPDPQGVGLRSDFFDPFLSRTYVRSRTDDQVLAGDVGENGLVAIIPETACIDEVDLVDGNCFQVLFSEPVEILLPRSGMTTTADELRICRDLIVGIAPPARLSSLEITAEGFDELRVTDIVLQEFDVFLGGLGEVQLDATGRSLVVSNLSGGDDGVSITFDETEAVGLAWAPPRAVAGEPTFLEIESRGSEAGTRQSLGRVRVEEIGSGLYDLQADFSTLGASEQIVRLFDDGEPIVELPAQPAPSVQVSALPIGANVLALPDRPAGLVCEWPEGSTFILDGIAYPGDELRIEAVGTTGTGGTVAECIVLAGGLEEIAFTDISIAGPCEDEALRVCLQQDRFQVEVRWSDFAGNSGSGRAVPLSSDTGYFYFFDDANVEVVVKVIDGRGTNGHFWIFYGALSNVEYEISITDTTTGTTRTYLNRAGTFASVGDITAFTADGFSGARSGIVREPGEGPIFRHDREAFADQPTNAADRAQKMEPCVAGATSLCLSQDRFRIEAEWSDFSGNSGSATAVPLTPDTGYFWFFDDSNVELILKVIDGRNFNDHFWVFYGALSNVEFRITVTDTVTGEVKVYENPSGDFASVGDTSAFEVP